MPKWTIIADTDVAKVGAPEIIAAAEAKTAGATVEAIADAVSAVRGACSTGNTLDADTAKVPNSLRALTARMAFWQLAALASVALTTDEAKQRDMDASRLNRISDQKVRFETPDVPSSGEMQQAGGIDVITSTNRDRYTRDGMNGL